MDYSKIMILLATFLIGVLMLRGSFAFKARNAWATKFILFILGIGCILVSGIILYHVFFD